jgi:hypothetical protein
VLSPNAPTLTAPGGGFTGWGNPNSQAYVFGAGSLWDDPLNSFITVPIDINPAAMPQVTFGAWVKSDVTDAVIRGIISHDDGGFDRTLDIDTRGGGVRWCMFTGAGGACDGAVTTDWTFLVARYDATAGLGQFTVDGAHLGTFAVSNGAGLTNTTIGRNPRFDFPFVGLIDSAFFFDEYLTDAQVDAIRTTGIQAVPEPSTAVLVIFGAFGLGARRLRRIRS